MKLEVGQIWMSNPEENLWDMFFIDSIYIDSSQRSSGLRTIQIFGIREVSDSRFAQIPWIADGFAGYGTYYEDTFTKGIGKYFFYVGEL